MKGGETPGPQDAEWKGPRGAGSRLPSCHSVLKASTTGCGAYIPGSRNANAPSYPLWRGGDGARGWPGCWQVTRPLALTSAPTCLTEPVCRGNRASQTGGRRDSLTWGPDSRRPGGDTVVSPGGREEDCSEPLLPPVLCGPSLGDPVLWPGWRSLASGHRAPIPAFVVTRRCPCCPTATKSPSLGTVRLRPTPTRACRGSSQPLASVMTSFPNKDPSQPISLRRHGQAKGLPTDPRLQRGRPPPLPKRAIRTQDRR